MSSQTTSHGIQLVSTYARLALKPLIVLLLLSNDAEPRIITSNSQHFDGSGTPFVDPVSNEMVLSRLMPHLLFAGVCSTKGIECCLILVMISISSIPISPLAQSAQGFLHLAPYGPILVEGDANLISSNGVVAGDGTPDDPYVIEGWEIGIWQVQSAIEIRNTTSYLVIRNTAIKGAPGHGVRLLNVTNCHVSNLEITGQTACGIRAISCKWITLTGNVIESGGIWLEQSAQSIVAGNRILGWHSADNVGIYNCTSITISGNTFDGCGIWLGGEAILHFNSHTITSDNSVNGKPVYYHKNGRDIEVNGTPIGQLLIVNCTQVLVANLNISDVDPAMLMAFSSDVIIRETDISLSSGMDRPMEFVHCSGFRVYHNNFFSYAWAVSAYGCEDMLWDDGYPSGGNYWVHYVGVDEMKGMDQNEAGSDGIGDRHYVVNDYLKFWDRYPLMKPYGTAEPESEPPWSIVAFLVAFTLVVFGLLYYSIRRKRKSATL